MKLEIHTVSKAIFFLSKLDSIQSDNSHWSLILNEIVWCMYLYLNVHNHMNPQGIPGRLLTRRNFENINWGGGQSGGGPRHWGLRYRGWGVRRAQHYCLSVVSADASLLWRWLQLCPTHIWFPLLPHRQIKMRRTLSERRGLDSCQTAASASVILCVCVCVTFK